MSNVWFAPVTNRSTADVNALKANPGMSVRSKGAMNNADLNRIGNNLLYLMDQIQKYGYDVRLLGVKKDWKRQDFPYKDEFEKIRKNIEALKEGYYVLAGTPELDWEDTFDWDDANDIEQNLLNLKILVERMVAGFRMCGGFSFYTGSEVVLP